MSNKNLFFKAFPAPVGSGKTCFSDPIFGKIASRRLWDFFGGGIFIFFPLHPKKPVIEAAFQKAAAFLFGIQNEAAGETAEGEDVERGDGQMG